MAIFGIGLLTACPGNLDDPGLFADASTSAHESSTDALAGGSCNGVVDNLFANTCSVFGCHASSMSAASIDLQSPNIYQRLVGHEAPDAGGVLIAPDGSASASVLYEVLTPSAPGGAQMPLGQAPVSSATLACVQEWIMDKGVTPQGGPPEAGSSDAGSSDSSADVTVSGDATPTDSGSPVDSSVVDVSSMDSKPKDAAPVDSGTKDSAAKDAAVDTSTVHDSATESGPKDTGSDEDAHKDGS